MKKKKNKKQSIAEKKHAELMQRKEFFTNLKKIIELAGSPNGFSYLPYDQLIRLYEIRKQSLRVVKDPESDISNDLIKAIQYFIKGSDNLHRIALWKGGPEVCINTYYSIVVFLESVMVVYKDKVSENLKKLRADLKTFTENFDYRIKESFMQVQESMLTVTFVENNFIDSYYWYDFNAETHDNRTHFLIKIFKEKAQRLEIEIDNSKREAYRIGFSMVAGSFKWLDLKPSVLLYTGVLASKKTDIYIQKHALERLYERLDCLDIPVIRASLIFTLMNVKDVVIAGENTRLIPYSPSFKKAGYLVAGIYDGVILIRTFIFLTMDSTPEGKKLEELSGMNRLDKQYWNMDKQSTFVLSDIAKKPELKKLFVDAGCGSLFELSCHKRPEERKNMEIADRMAMYFGLMENTMPSCLETEDDDSDDIHE